MRRGHLDRDGRSAHRTQRRTRAEHPLRRQGRRGRVQRREHRLPDHPQGVRHRGRPAEGHPGRAADRRRRERHRPPGPGILRETSATGDVFSQAGLPSLSASATNPDITKNGWKTFFRGLANDAVQGPAVAKYMVDTLGYEKVCVVQDNSDYGVGLAKEITAGLGDAVDDSCSAEVKVGDKDFAAATQLISSSDADAVFYAGYYAEAAPFAQQLRDAGVEIPFVSADGTNDPQFVTQAGAASEGAILSCPCGPAPDEFAATYEELNGQAPGVYSVEGYDLATIMLTAIASGVTDRAGMLDFVANYDGEGLARTYEWDDTGELSSALIWIYEVK
ncbi:branched-chain amino acid ABC transporter substrate-binding protein [Oerskovia sp. M15]